MNQNTHDAIPDGALEKAEEAARAAGALLMEHYEKDLQVDDFLDHDIKLELDVRSQKTIAKILLDAFPEHAFHGEEGIEGQADSDLQWVVDPIDGTVNYFYGIPHFCVSIALRRGEEIMVGVIFDPNMDEVWTVTTGRPTRLNGREVRVSSRSRLADAVITVGFSKSDASLDAGFRRFQTLAYQVRKTRMLGSAALAMAYIACGRLDAYIEEEISIWDIAAGKLMVEASGGSVQLEPSRSKPNKFFICASNGSLPLESSMRQV